MSQVVLHVGKVAGISGSEAHLLLLLPALRELGWDVRFVLLHEDEPGAREFASRLESAGVPVDEVRLPWAVDPRAFRRLLSVVRRHRPALLHTHLVHADFHGLSAGRLARVPVLASTKHGFNPFRARRGFATADRAIGRLADLHIAISAGLARYLAQTEGFAEDDFEVVHYGIVPAAEPPPAPEQPRLAVVGRLVPIKGHATLLDAIAMAARDAPGLELEIAGAGPLEQELRDRVAALGLDGTVRLLGQVPGAAGVMEQAAVVVVPSLGEGFGMVALEAMERGRAVIASDVGGLPEIVVAGETGLLVPPGDADALAAAIVELARDPSRARAFGAAGRVRAVAEFSQERCTRRTDELYRAALDRAARMDEGGTGPAPTIQPP
jgi:glycosyltransferase involved in cell wall biosynthesis